MRALIPVLAATGVMLAAGCGKKARTYETRVTLKSIQVVTRDAAGTPQVLEVNVEYPDCAGEQLETLQGNAEFTKCALKFKVGDVLPASLEWGPTDFGHYDSEITRIGDCPRKRDPRDARSYEVVQVCNDVNVNGVKAGFHCDRKPSKELLTQCPWFTRE